MVPLSILDLVPIKEDTTPGQALRQSLELAKHAERLGYNRYWVAEHHNMIGIGSAATSVVIGFLAGGTSTLRVGSGGIMLPNHSPMVIAEQFGTLASLYPGRIDLGVGRAPGTDMSTMRALRRNANHAENFPQDVRELQALLAPVESGQTLQAVPGGGTEVPIWILGSSLFGAQLAAAFGLPYAFASHFAPDACLQALELYRAGFRPSAQLRKPYAMIGVNVVAADTDAEARRLFTSPQQAFTNILRDTRGYCPPPIDSIEEYWSPSEKAQVSRMLEYSVVGSAAAVREGLRQLVAKTGADELMVTAHLHDPAARMRSYAILAEAAGSPVPEKAPVP
ncbi:MAG: class flavin-dependent oxidoreductase [Fibrobacteres bacterium]|nr:class flavin-dependent oxidoreductase [Fibrobacterota bacterium]